MESRVIKFAVSSSYLDISKDDNGQCHEYKVDYSIQEIQQVKH